MKTIQQDDSVRQKIQQENLVTYILILRVCINKRAGPVLACTLVEILPSFISARLKNKLNKFNPSSINWMVQSRTFEAQTLNSHVIKTIIDSDWLRGSKTIPILWACTFGIGRFGRISESLLRGRCICTNNPQFGRKRPRHLVGYCIDCWG